MFRYFRSTVLGNCAIELDGDVYQLFMDGQLATKNLRRRWAADRKSEDAGVLAGRHAPDVQIGNFCRHRRSEEHTSELQSLMRNSYAAFCLKKNKYELHKTYYITDHTSNNNRSTI